MDNVARRLMSTLTFRNLAILAIAHSLSALSTSRIERFFAFLKFSSLFIEDPCGAFALLVAAGLGTKPRVVGGVKLRWHRVRRGYNLAKGE